MSLDGCHLANKIKATSTPTIHKGDIWGPGMIWSTREKCAADKIQNFNDWKGFNVPHQHIISEMSLSTQSLALALTTDRNNQETEHRKTQNIQTQSNGP